MPLASGTRLGAYEILSGIGAGGMGEVYRARDARLDRQVAIKVLPAAMAADPHHLARFEREAKALAALNHPNIAQIYGLETSDTSRALILELVDGPTIEDLVRQGSMAASEALPIAQQMASALEAAHSVGIIHRDLKPANVKVRPDGVVKVLDLGLAKRLHPRTSDDEPTLVLNEGDLTTDGFVVGTPAYMSPEQASGEALDPRSDIFSFGATLYELVSGRRPFRGRSIAELLTSVLRDDPPALSSPLWPVIARCLAKSPANRYQSMSEVREALLAASGAPPRAEERPSIAVLPFANMSREADDEYFSDGLTEEILNALTEIPGLKVIARTSAFAFKGKNEDIRRIAESLGVTNILEGSVRRAGPRLRITAQLVQSADGTQLWSQRFDREMTDVFAVQDEISAAISAALRLKFTRGADEPKKHEPDLHAHDVWLKALYHYRIHEPQNFGDAETFLRQAIALDAEWSEPRSLLAERNLQLATLSLRPLEEAIATARMEANKAVSLRPGDATGHAVLGAIAGVHDYDWIRAGDEFRRALSDGAPPVVRSTFAHYYLQPLGRFDEAIEENDKAISLDPLNGWWQARTLVILLCAGRYADAMAEAQQTMAAGRGGHLEAWAIGFGHLCLGNWQESVEHLEDGFRRAPWHVGIAGLLAGALSVLGDEERSKRVLESVRGGMTNTGMVMYHLVRSDSDRAIDCYEREVAQRHPIAAQFANAHFQGSMRANPRWAKIASAMNLAR